MNEVLQISLAICAIAWAFAGIAIAVRLLLAPPATLRVQKPEEEDNDGDSHGPEDPRVPNQPAGPGPISPFYTIDPDFDPGDWWKHGKTKSR